MKNKKRIIKIIIAWLILIGLVFGLVGCNSSKKDDINNKVVETNDQLKPNSIQINQKYTDKKITNAESAIDSLNEVADVLGITNAQEEFELKNEGNSMGNTHYRLAQIYKGIPVYGRDISVHVYENGDVFGLTSNYILIDKNFSVIPKYSEEEILNKAKDYFQKEFSCDIETIITGTPEVIIDTMYTAQPTLVYTIDMSGGNSESGTFFLEVSIDANKNEVYHAGSTISFYFPEKAKGQTGEEKTINVEVNNNIISLKNDFYKKEIGSTITTSIPKDSSQQYRYNWFENENSKIVSWEKGSESNPSAVDAMFNVSKVLYYYYDVLERKSFDDKGEDVNVYVNVAGFKDYDYDKQKWTDNNRDWKNNAFYVQAPNGKKLIAFTVNDGEYEDSASFGTVAHEFTHGIEDTMVGLIHNFKQSHSLKEAYADIFEKLINDSTSEKYDGKKADWNSGRNMQNPNLSKLDLDATGWGKGIISYPKKMSEYRDIGQASAHYNSTIISHTAYLMWNGGINGEWARIEDTKLLAKLWYGSLNFLNSNSNFSDCRNAVIVSATKLYAEKVITEEQLETVVQAFEEVGLGVKTTNIHYGFNAKEEFNLNIYNLIKKTHSNYHLKIEHIMANYVPGEVIVDEDVKTDSKSLTLKNHSNNIVPETYLLTITNLENPNQQQSIYITIKNGGFSSTDKVDIYTNFSPAIKSSELKTVTPNESDFKELKKLLDYAYNLVWSEYDCQKDNTEKIISEIISTSFSAPVYDYYFGNNYEKSNSDPLNKFDCSLKMSSNNVDWIVENIFNSKVNHNINSADLYYKDDFYYRSTGDAGYIGHKVEIRKYNQLSDGKYSAICDFSIGYDEIDRVETKKIIVDLKLINGSKYWTFYNISSESSREIDKQNDIQSSESSKKAESEIVTDPESELKKLSLDDVVVLLKKYDYPVSKDSSYCFKQDDGTYRFLLYRSSNNGQILSGSIVVNLDTGIAFIYDLSDSVFETIDLINKNIMS